MVRVTADDIVAAATVAGVVVARLFGVTGFVVGLVGLHQARKAKEAAAAANIIGCGTTRGWVNP